MNALNGVLFLIASLYSKRIAISIALDIATAQAVMMKKLVVTAGVQIAVNMI